MTLTHGSLFAGIGGFDLGFQRAGIKTIWQVEIDAYYRRVLARHFPAAERFGDIRDCCGLDCCDPGKWRDGNPPCPKHHLRPVDILSGGFPCQDESFAGKRAGIENGERSGLWREYARIIRELRPRIVVVENVPGLLSPIRRGKRIEQAAGISRVLGDLAACGYDAEWDCLSAGMCGAHFLRNRVFIIASRSEPYFGRPQGGRPRPTGTWSEQQFARLLRDYLEHAVPAGRNSRISDGISHRMDRLRGLGNAVVPQITEIIGRWLAEALGEKEANAQQSLKIALDT